MIMGLLDNKKLRKFEKHWKKFEDGMSQKDFVKLVSDTLKDQKLLDDEKYELAAGCLRLFAEVDINGDGGMEWYEFLDYIIDCVQSNTIKNQKKCDDGHHHDMEEENIETVKE